MNYQERLAEIAALEDNWDGAGSEKISPGVIESAKRFLVGYPTPDTIVPSPDGSIVCVWTNLAIKYVEAEISPENTNRVEWVFTSDNGKHQHFQTSVY